MSTMLCKDFGKIFLPALRRLAASDYAFAALKEADGDVGWGGLGGLGVGLKWWVLIIENLCS